MCTNVIILIKPLFDFQCHFKLIVFSFWSVLSSQPLDMLHKR